MPTVYAVVSDEPFGGVYIQAMFLTLEEACSYYIACGDGLHFGDIHTYQLSTHSGPTPFIVDGVHRTEPESNLGQLWQRLYTHRLEGVVCPWWLSKDYRIHCADCKEPINPYLISECSECDNFFCLHCVEYQREWHKQSYSCDGHLHMEGS